VLFVDGLKNWKRRSELRPYPVWIVANSLLCAVCLIASQLVLLDFSLKTVSVAILGDVTLFTLSLVVFVCAVVRTIVDYLFGEVFLFPGTKTGHAI
jgi:membrane protein implicated in regulation of membrane protease activity